MSDKKPHLSANTAQKLFRLNSMMRQLPSHLAQAAGASYLSGTKHQKAWGDYGYPRALSFIMYKDMYDRIGAARNGCDTWVDNCWLTQPTISIGEDDHEREGAEVRFGEYADRVGFFEALNEADRLQTPAHYSAIIVRVADGQRPSQPMQRVALSDIKQLISVWEHQLIPSKLDTDPQSDRYGLPVTYTYNARAVTNAPDQRDNTASETVHWTRVWIFAEGANGNSIYGTSKIEPAFNALMDWEKMRGSGGEGAWRAAAQRFVMTAKEGMQRPDDETLDALSETLTEMFESFDTVPYIGGSELTSLDNNLPNVEHYLEASRQDVAAGFKLSTKGIFGSQEGQLAGEQDSNSDARKFQSRRENYLKRAIMKVIQWHVEFTDLGDDDWQVSWDDLGAPSKEDKLKNAKLMFDMMGTFDADEIRIEAGYEAEEVADLFDEDEREDGELGAPKLDGEGDTRGSHDVQREALNGAQINAIKEIAQDVAAGRLPKNVAIELILIAVPVLERSQAEAMMDVPEGFSVPEGD